MPSTSSIVDAYVDEQGRSDAEVYLTDIYDGRIIASKWMRILAENMLPRFHEEYHGYHFNIEFGARVCYFVEHFCCFPEGSKMGKPFLLLPFQKSALQLAYSFVDEDDIREYRQVIMEVARKNGKCLSLDTEVATPSGWRRIDDIHAGDYVFGQDGNPSRVIAESDVFHDKPVFLVTFEDGSKIKATHDHVWTVVGENETLAYAELVGSAKSVTTQEMFDDFDPSKYHVPLCKPVEYGSKRLAKRPYDVGKSVVGRADAEIPDEYLTGSVSQRMEFVSGIDDACRQYGILSPTFGTRTVAESVAEAYSSLGVFARVFESNLRDGGTAYFVSRDRSRKTKAVVSIGRIPNEPTKCIAIDNQSHLYLVGRQYTATHNTSLMSALCLYHLTSDGELGAEVYNCAKNEQQARKCYGSADAMRLNSPYLRNRIRRGMSQKSGKSALNYDKNGSTLLALSGKASTKDGLSASAVIYDELASVEDNGALFEQLEESTTARRQPITWVISSENNITIDGIWDERLKYCHGILNGTIQDDTVLPLLYTQDDRSEVIQGLEDYERGERPDIWLRANPGLYEIKDENKLIQRVRQGRASPRRLSSVLCKEFCLKTGSYSAFLSIEACINETEIDFDEIGIPPYVCVGFDLANRNDLCSAVARWMVPGDNRIYELAKFWVASDMVNMQTDSNQKDRVPYLFWSEQGQPMDGTIWHYVDIVEGDRVGFDCVLDFLNDLVNVGMYPYCVGYDPWRVGELEDRTLRRLVGDSRCFAVPQTARVISPLMREHELDLNAHKVICPNVCLHHSRSSVQARVDNNNNIFPQKKDLQPHQKIDGFMAELFSLAAFNKYKDEYLASIGWAPEQRKEDEG